MNTARTDGIAAVIISMTQLSDATQADVTTQKALWRTYFSGDEGLLSIPPIYF